MADNNNGKVILAGGTGVVLGSIMTLIANAQAVKASGGSGGNTTFGLDQATEDLLTAIAQASAQTLSDLEAIVAALTNNSITVQGYAKNAPSITAGNLPVGATAINLPNILVPDDFCIVVRSHPLNTSGSFLYVAESKGNAQNPGTSWPLSPNEWVAYKVQNASVIWVSATANAQTVCWTVEQKQGS